MCENEGKVPQCEPNPRRECPVKLTLLSHCCQYLGREGGLQEVETLLFLL